MDPGDELDRVYEALVHWADVVLVATPIRWGAASSLYYRMAERMNCIQNQVTTHDRVLIRDKVAGFIVIGGQDNVQAVAGQMLGFFAELGFLFPQFPYVAHSRGWTAEDMEKNVAVLRTSRELREGVECPRRALRGSSRRACSRPSRRSSASPAAAARPTRSVHPTAARCGAGVIEVEGLTRRYDGTLAVDGVSFRVEAGELLALVGGSGSGKTTTLKMINRLVEPDAGRVVLDGRDAASLEPHALRRSIGYVFQGVGLFPHMSVAENVAVPLRLAGGPRERIDARVAEMLRLVELDAELGGPRPRDPLGGPAAAGRAWPAPSPPRPASCSSTSRSAPSTPSPATASRARSTRCAGGSG